MGGKKNRIERVADSIAAFIPAETTDDLHF
jgi:hypothetical protein